jgi:ribonuclease HI
MEKVRIFTDGAIHNHGKIGGWAAVILRDGQNTLAIAGHVLDTTSNRMELTSVIEALEFTELELIDTSPFNKLEIEVTSDSQYVVYGCSTWLKKWKENDWRGAGGKIQNRDLWEKLDTLIQRGNIKFHWVRGHNGNYYNEICDKLAVAQYEQFDKSEE